MMDAIACRPCTTVRRSPIVVAVSTIGCPLPHIAQHIEKTPGVGSERTNRGGVNISVRTCSVYIGLLGKLLAVASSGTIGKGTLLGCIVAPVSRRNAACSCRVFPLSFSGQAITATGLLRQPFDIRADVRGVHADHRVSICLRETGIAPTCRCDVLPVEAVPYIASGSVVAGRCYKIGELSACNIVLGE